MLIWNNTTTTAAMKRMPVKLGKFVRGAGVVIMIVAQSQPLRTPRASAPTTMAQAHD